MGARTSRGDKKHDDDKPSLASNNSHSGGRQGDIKRRRRVFACARVPLIEKTISKNNQATTSHDVGWQR
jgi:hypothetical protein